MKKLLILLSIFIISSTTFASVSTNVSSIKDPDFNNAKYSNVLVFSTVGDLSVKQTIENAFVEQFKNKKINVFTGVNVFPPTRQYTEEDINKRLNEFGIESVLIFTLSKYNEKTEEVDLGQTSFTSGNAYTYGNNINYNSTTTSQHNKFSYSIINVTYQFELIDVQTNRKAWMATTNTSTAWMLIPTEKAIAKTIAKNLVNQLEKDELLNVQK